MAISGVDGSRVPNWVSWILLLGVALGLRVWGLQDNPNGFWIDEAVNGYYSYCLLETGLDPTGDFLPLVSRSMAGNENSYRLLTVPSIALFGLTAFAVRLPAALAGMLTVWSLQRVTSVWFGRVAAWSAAWLLALSPWHLQFSRAAFRTILLPLVVCLALQAFQKGIGDRPRRLMLSGFLFGLGLYSYSAGRVFVPILVAGLCLFFRRELWERRRYTIGFVLIFGAMLLVLLPFWVSGEGLARAESVRVESWTQGVLNYLSYFSPTFLFFEGDDNLRHSLKGFGQLHRMEILTLLLGFTAMASERRRPHLILMVWLAGLSIGGSRGGRAVPCSAISHRRSDLRDHLGSRARCAVLTDQEASDAAGGGGSVLGGPPCVGRHAVEGLLWKLPSLCGPRLEIRLRGGTEGGRRDVRALPGDEQRADGAASLLLVLSPGRSGGLPSGAARSMPDSKIESYTLGTLHVLPVEPALVQHSECAFITEAWERPLATDGHTVHYPDGTIAMHGVRAQSEGRALTSRRCYGLVRSVRVDPQGVRRRLLRLRWAGRHLVHVIAPNLLCSSVALAPRSTWHPRDEPPERTSGEPLLAIRGLGA